MIFIANTCTSTHLQIEYNRQDDFLLLNLLPPPIAPVQASLVMYSRRPNSGWCLVQDNLSAPDLAPAALQWLTGYVVPVLRAAGVRYWAWVCGPTLASYHLAEKVMSQLPQLVINIFHDLEHATTWMQQQLAARQPTPPQRLHQPAEWTTTRHLSLPGLTSFGHRVRHVA